MEAEISIAQCSARDKNKFNCVNVLMRSGQLNSLLQ